MLAASAALLAAGLAGDAGFVAAGMGIPLFSRHDRSRLLESAARRRLMESVRKTPGATVAQLGEASDLRTDTARYHLRLLKKHGHARSFRHAGRWRYVAVETSPVEVHRRLAMATDGHVRELVRRLGEGERSRFDVVRHLMVERGLSRTGARKVVDRARRAGLVAQDRFGTRAMVRLIASVQFPRNAPSSLPSQWGAPQSADRNDAQQSSATHSLDD